MATLTQTTRSRIDQSQRFDSCQPIGVTGQFISASGLRQTMPLPRALEMIMVASGRYADTTITSGVKAGMASRRVGMASHRGVEVSHRDVEAARVIDAAPSRGDVDGLGIQGRFNDAAGTFATSLGFRPPSPPV